MKIIIESTTKTVYLNGVPARIWEGFTDTGIPVHCFITRIACKANEDQSQFERELVSKNAPSAEIDKAYPLKLFI